MKAIKKTRILFAILPVFALTACNDFGNVITLERANEIAQSILKKSSERQLHDYSDGFTINTKTTYSSTQGLGKEIYDAIGIQESGSFEELISYYPKQKVMLTKTIIKNKKGQSTITDSYILLKKDIFYYLSVENGRRIGSMTDENAKLFFSESVLKIANERANNVDDLIELTTLNTDSFILAEIDPFKSTNTKYYSTGNGNITVENQYSYTNMYESMNSDIVISSGKGETSRLFQFKNYLEDSDKISNEITISGSFLDKKFEIVYNIETNTKITWKATKFTVPNILDYSFPEEEI